MPSTYEKPLPLPGVRVTRDNMPPRNRLRGGSSRASSRFHRCPDRNAVVPGAHCLPAAAQVPEEKELIELKEELKQLEADIAGQKRIAAASGEAPADEFQDLEDKRDRLAFEIEELERKIASQQDE